MGPRLSLVWLVLALSGLLLAPSLRLWLLQTSNLPSSELGTAVCVPGAAQTDQTCTAQHADKSVTLALPLQVRTLVPIPVAVQWVGFTPHQVQAQLTMVGMEMYLPTTELAHDVNTEHWTAILVLPVCSLGRRDWQLTLTASDTQQQVRVQFNFQSAP